MLMNKTCRFNRTYNRVTNKYSISFKSLSKEQADIICSLFSNLESNGIILQYCNGFTLPYLQVSSAIPLVSAFRGLLAIPNSYITDIVCHFGNSFGRKNPLLDSNGQYISKST